MSHILALSFLLFAPFAAFLINGYFCKHLQKTSGIISSIAAFISFCFSIYFFHQVSLNHFKEKSGLIKIDFFPWFQVGNLNLNFSFLIDELSSLMLLVCCGISFLIKIYSIKYMENDKSISRFFSYMSLFLFFMLILVLADNLLVMFIGWEGVGLASYLLIGFWFSDKEKARCGMKAFLVNRVGDVFFLLALFFLFKFLGTLNFEQLRIILNENSFSLFSSKELLNDSSILSIIAILLFLGASGKSAQIPLYVWLPDAMAGPTPVSALIHAATMVTAGVYMIVRLNFLYVLTPNILIIIAVLGILTILLAGSIAITQWDIKKILAYSTISQLGFMFLGLGVGAFSSAIFHLITHAFFKALLFLAAGSIIHYLHEQQDIRYMGKALREKMPVTFICFSIGWLAIIGIPPLSGFFSKEEILWFSFYSTKGSVFYWLPAMLGVALTAFYMTRLYLISFFDYQNHDQQKKILQKEKVESKLKNTILLILAFLSLIAGIIGIPHIFYPILPGDISHLLNEWLNPVVTNLELKKNDILIEWIFLCFSLSTAGIFAWLAYELYFGSFKKSLNKFFDKFKIVHQLISNKYFIDELYNIALVNPLLYMSKKIWLYGDLKIIDGFTYFISDMVKGSGRFFKSMQNGDLNQYLLYVSLGILLISSIVLMW